MIILLVLCFPIGVRVVVGTYLFAASCSIFCLFFCCYTLILYSLQKNGSWRLLLPILVPVNLLDVSLYPTANYHDGKQVQHLSKVWCNHILFCFEDSNFHVKKVKKNIYFQCILRYSLIFLSPLRKNSAMKFNFPTPVKGQASFKQVQRKKKSPWSFLFLLKPTAFGLYLTLHHFFTSSLQVW
jgi:hypothetical protein